LLVELLFAHAVADFGLQSDTMAKLKSRRADVKRGEECQWKFRDGKYQLTWMYWLTAHALIHGAMAFLFSGSMLAALIITAAHWVLDYCKTQDYWGIHIDQGCHLLIILLCALTEGNE